MQQAVGAVSAAPKYIYRVRNWDQHYEVNRTRELKRMDWLPLTNDIGGDGYTWLISQPGGIALFGVWICILQIASRCSPRGTLIRSTGEPHDAESIARLARVSPDIVLTALNSLVSRECQWLTRDVEKVRKQRKTKEQIPHPPAGIPQDDAVIPHLHAASRAPAIQQNRTEQNREGTETCAPAARDDGRDLYEWFCAEYPGEIADTLWRTFPTLVGADHELLRRHLPLWKQTRKYREGFAPKAINFLKDGIFKRPPPAEMLGQGVETRTEKVKRMMVASILKENAL